MGAGESWKKKREAMGKSIDDMSTDLRVAPKYLRAIEEGAWEGWPVRVFSTGFIRAYARKLSMDPEPVLSEYFRFVDAKAGTEPPLQVRPEWLEREKERGSRRTVYTVAAGAVLLVGIVMAWYSTRSIPTPPRVPQVPAAPAPAPAVENAVPVPAIPAPDDGNAGKGKAGAQQATARDRKPATGTGAPAPAGARTGTPAAGSPATGAPAVAAAGAAGRAPASAAGPSTVPYQLVLEAKEATWVLYGRDDETPVEALLQPGDRISIQAERKIYLKLGNAGGVGATLNGKALPPFGEAGRVKVIRLGK